MPLMAPAPSVEAAARRAPLIVVDLETTGLSTADDRIVCIAASCAGKEFHALVNPLRPIPEGASRVHGIEDARVAREPPWGVVGSRFWAWVAERAATVSGSPDAPVLLAAHNGRRFDWPLLLNETERAGQAPGGRVLLVDTLRVSRSLFALQSHRQPALFRYLFGEARPRRRSARASERASARALARARAPQDPADQHDALGDVRALRRIVERLEARGDLRRFAEEVTPAHWGGARRVEAASA